MSATNDVQRAMFDSLSEKQIGQCRAILTYHLGGRQEKWPLDRHDKAGGYDLPLTASERELTHLTKNHVVALILRICGVEESVHVLQSSLAELRARREAAEKDAERLRQFERWADDGLCPCLVFDDDGHWAVSFAGSGPCAQSDEITSHVAVVEPHEWSDSVGEAIDAALATQHAAQRKEEGK